MSIANGRTVESITYECIDGQCYNYTDVAQDRILKYTSENYGDHAENWIVLYEKGVETIRYNMKYIISIVWFKE